MLLISIEKVINFAANLNLHYKTKQNYEKEEL